MGPSTQANACSSAIFVNKFDAGAFECPLNHVQCRAARLVPTRLQLPNSYDANTGGIGEILLSPGEQAARCPALRRT
jgi:hypothetical protein